MSPVTICTNSRSETYSRVILSNGMDRSWLCAIYPVLDKPHTTGAFQDRRKIEALLRPALSFM